MHYFTWRLQLVLDILWMVVDLLKDRCNCFLFSLVKKHLSEHIMYYNFSFLMEKSFRNLSSLLHNFISLLSSFLSLSRFCVSLKSLDNSFLEGLLTSLFLTDFQCFYIQLFPAFFRVRVQVLEVAFKASAFLQISFPRKLNIWERQFFSIVNVWHSFTY